MSCQLYWGSPDPAHTVTQARTLRVLSGPGSPATSRRGACSVLRSPGCTYASPVVTQELWTAVDRYIGERLLAEDPVLDTALAASDAAGLPAIAITPSQGKLLELLARIHGARSILELGTLGGYSTIWLARALPRDGRVVTLELDSHYADVARANIANAGLAEIVQLRVGPALQALSELHAEGDGPFDLIFIDADKQNNPGYLEWSLKLSRPGTLIIADNVVRGGAILDPTASDPRLGDGGVRGVRRFYELLGAEPRVSATAIQTVGAKGHDGFALALVNEHRQVLAHTRVQSDG
jgi:predicted O-methyltransferase YrrM